MILLSRPDVPITVVVRVVGKRQARVQRIVEPKLAQGESFAALIRSHRRSSLIVSANALLDEADQL
jgi:hypothetical protein